MITERSGNKLQKLIDRSKDRAPIRVAVVNAAQDVVLQTLHQAIGMRLVEPILIGDSKLVEQLARKTGTAEAVQHLIEAKTDAEAAALGVALVRNGKADALMKGLIHTDVFLRAILDSDRGLRLPGKRVSHAFLCDIPAYKKLLVVTDAAINIAPDLNAKAQILQNAIEFCQLLDIETPKVAVLSAVETVNAEIPSTLDAAALTLMARRGQIYGASVDGPLAFDNAISLAAAEEKGIASDVAGESDVLLVPDLVSGNILAKNLEYLAGAVAAGVVLGISVPVILSSRSDPAPGRLAALALAALIHNKRPRLASHKVASAERTLEAMPQSESACCPLPG